MAVSNEYENGQPQTIAVFGGYDVVAGTLSGSDMAASHSSIYLSRSVAGLIVNQSQAFEDSVTEVLVDGGGGFPKLPESPAASTSATAEHYGGPVSSLAIDGLAAGLSIPEDGPNPTLAYCPVSDTCISPYPPQSDPFPGWAVASLHTETRLAAETTRDLFIQGLTETGWHMVQDSLSESTYQGFPSTEMNLGAQAPNGVGLDYISLRIYRSADPAVAYTDIEGYITRDGYCALNKGGAYANGHGKVPTGGQVEVPSGGQVKVPTPCSSCRSGALALGGDRDGANRSRHHPGSSIEVCEGTNGHHRRLPRGGHLSGGRGHLRHDPQDREAGHRARRGR